MDYLTIYVDTYLVDSAVDSMAAPAAVRSAPEPQPRYDAQATRLARGVWRITGGTMVTGFDDHLTLFEINGGPVRAEAVIAVAKTLVPGKPLTEMVVSHHHFDPRRVCAPPSPKG